MTLRPDDPLLDLEALDHSGATVTEAFLRTLTDTRGRSPYEWFGELGLTVEGPVIDMACGTGPMASRLRPDRYLGVDRDGEAVAAARRRHPGHAFVVADALEHLDQVSQGSIALVLCSMSLHLVSPLPAVLRSIHRCLAPGGRLAALIPTTVPIAADAMVLRSGLKACLQITGSDPNRDAWDDVDGTMSAARYRMQTISTAAFDHPVDDIRSASWIVATHSPPGTPPLVRGAARDWLLANAPCVWSLGLTRFVATT